MVSWKIQNIFHFQNMAILELTCIVFTWEILEICSLKSWQFLQMFLLIIWQLQIFFCFFLKKKACFIHMPILFNTPSQVLLGFFSFECHYNLIFSLLANLDTRPFSTPISVVVKMMAHAYCFLLVVNLHMCLSCLII